MFAESTLLKSSEIIGRKLIVIYFLISILTTIVYTQDDQLVDCFNFPQEEDLNLEIPKCKLNISGVNSTLTKQTVECWRILENVYRIIGEYGELTINCSAPFYLDVDYDGFRPTEAVQVRVWKEYEIENEGKEGMKSVLFKSYWLTVTIYSIKNLFQKNLINLEGLKLKGSKWTEQFANKNISSPIIYPRTAGFNIRPLLLKENITQKSVQFYFFFEEPLLGNELFFVENEHTQPKIILKDDDTKQSVPFLIIPCRPSHYKNSSNVKVTLLNNSQGTSVRDITLEGSFDPRRGFEVKTSHIFLNTETTEEFSFSCIFNSVKKSVWSGKINHSRSLTNVVKDESIYGLSTLGLRHECLQLALTNEVTVTPNQTWSILRCTFGLEPTPESVFMCVGWPHMTITQLRFSREFVLPIYSNLNYSMQVGQRLPGSYEFRVERSSPTGVCFCSNGRSYNFIEYTSGLTSREYKFAPGTNWVALPFHKTLAEIQIQLRRDLPASSTAKLYSHDLLRFTCRYVTNHITRPILWFTKTTSDTQNIVFQDTGANGFSILEIKLTSDVKELICMGSNWNSAHWKEAKLPIYISVGVKPTILTSKTDLTYNFQLKDDSTDRVLTCEAEGEPAPSVWWEKDDQELQGSRSDRVSYHQIVNLTKDSLGTYLCYAENSLGKSFLKFHVNSTLETSNSFGHTALITGLVICIVLSSTIVIFFFVWKKRVKAAILTNQEISEFRNGLMTPPTSNDYSAPMSAPYAEEYEIPKDNFTIDETKVLGRGIGGVVMEGTVNGQLVAAKTVKNGTEKDHLKSLLSELKIMIYLGKHPSVIKLIGASTQNIKRGIVFVFVELCEMGNLLHHLQTNRKSFLSCRKSTIDKPDNVDLLYKWAYQLASGMEFLASKKVIHGDLACRNVLLTADKSVKITDFGLSRQLQAYSMYMKQNQIGDIPFPGVSWTIEFIESLQMGLRMNCPTLMPEELYAKLLVPCWYSEPEARPSFDTICQILEDFAPGIVQKTSNQDSH